MMAPELPDGCELIVACPCCGGLGVLRHGQLTERFLRQKEAPACWQLWACASCGHGWLSPRYSEDAIGRAYAEYSGAMWRDGQHRSTARWKEGVREAFLAWRLGYPVDAGRGGWVRRVAGLPFGSRFARQVRWLRYRPGGRLLDVGSGDGWFVAHMRELGWECRALDVDPVSASRVRKLGVPTDVGTLETQRYPAEHFDAVTLSHVLEHLHRPREALAECRRILKKGGRLVVITPNMQSLAHARFGACWQGLETPRHLHLFTRRSLDRMAGEAGFEIRMLRTSVRGARLQWLRSRQIERRGAYGGAERHGLRDHVRAILFQCGAWCAVLRDRDCGEELIFEGEA